MRKRAIVLDTDPEAERMLIKMARAMPIEKKFAQVVSATETCRALARAGIRRRYPDASEEEVRRRLAAVVLDRETVLKVYGWDPDVEGY